MLSDWWNGVELWVLGLPFPFQFALVVVLLVPVCLVVAWLIDRIVDHASALFGAVGEAEEPLGAETLDEDAVVDGPVVEPVVDEVEADGPAADVAEERVPAESTGR